MRNVMKRLSCIALIIVSTCGAMAMSADITKKEEEKDEGRVVDQTTKEALRSFFSDLDRLARLGIILSNRYTDDISAYLCGVFYDFRPVKSGRESGHDGVIGTSRVKIIFNNCPRGTAVRFDGPIDFDELIVILGPNSLWKPDAFTDDFVIFRFSKKEFLRFFRIQDETYSARGRAFSKKPDRVLSLTPP